MRGSRWCIGWREREKMDNLSARLHQAAYFVTPAVAPSKISGLLVQGPVAEGRRREKGEGRRG